MFKTVAMPIDILTSTKSSSFFFFFGKKNNGGKDNEISTFKFDIFFLSNSFDRGWWPMISKHFFSIALFKEPT